MSSINKVLILGTLGADPKIKYTEHGIPLAILSVATEERCKDISSGVMQYQVEWHKVVFSGKQAEIAEQYLKKGSKIFAEGKLHTREWEDTKGVKKYLTEVIATDMKLLDSPEVSKPDNDELEEDIPF